MRECKPIATITMSEACWERIEERHKRVKNKLLVALVVVSVLMAATNALWIIRLFL